MTNTEVNPFASLLKETRPHELGLSKDLVEEVLLFTLRQQTPNKTNALLYLGTLIVPDDTNDTHISEELLSHALFERLLLNDIENYTLINEKAQNAAAALEQKVLHYLFRAFITCNQVKTKYNNVECEKLIQLILTNASTCMRQPELFQHQSLHLQWLELFETADETDIHTFLVHSSKRVFDNEEKLEALGALKAIFYPLLNELQKSITKANIINLKDHVFQALSYFVRDKQFPELGEIIIDYMTPNPNAKGQ